MSNIRLTLIFLLLLLNIPYLFSQDNNEDEEIYQLFDISLEDILNVDIVSATLQKQSVQDAPANAVIITKEQINMRGYQNLVDLLMDIPQVELQINSDPEHRNTLSMRGVVGNEKVLILLNGNRITPTTGDFYTLGQQFSLQMAERVEVIIGPASALYGVDAFAGIINIITKNRSDSFEKADVAYQRGSFGSSSLSYSAGQDFGEVRLYLSGQITKADNPYYPKYYPEHYAWYTNQFKANGYVKQSALNPQILNMKQFEYEAGDSFFGNEISREFDIPSSSSSFFVEATIKDFSVGYVRMEEIHSTSYGIDPSLTSYDGAAQIRTTQDVAYISHDYSSFDNRLQVKSQINFNLHEIHPESHFANVTSMWQRGYFYGYSTSGKMSEQITFRINDKLNLTAGGSAEFLTALPRTALSPQPFQEDKTLGEQEFYYLGAAGYLPLQYFDNGSLYPNLDNPSDPAIPFADSLTLTQVFHFIHYFNKGIFSQLIWDLNTQTNLTLGFRYDVNSRYGKTYNPRIGLVRKSMDNRYHFKLMYGTAFLAPSPSKSFKQEGAFFGPSSRFLLDGGVAVPGTFFAASFHHPNPNLKPERLGTLESSVSYLFSKNFSLDLNAFSSTIKNNINLFAPYSDEDKASHVFSEKETTSSNTGDLNVKGISLNARYFNKIGNIQINSFVSGFLMEGTSRTSNNELIDLHFYQAERTLKGGVEVWNDRFSISTRVNWKNYTESNPDDPYKVP